MKERRKPSLGDRVKNIESCFVPKGCLGEIFMVGNNTYGCLFEFTTKAGTYQEVRVQLEEGMFELWKSR